jgi:hypothetical protein
LVIGGLGIYGAAGFRARARVCSFGFFEFQGSTASDLGKGFVMVVMLTVVNGDEGEGWN